MEVRSSEIMKSTLYFFGAAKEVTTKKKNVRMGGHFLFTCPLLIIHRRTQALNKMISGMVNSQTVLLTLVLEQQHCGVQVVEWVGLVDLFRAVFAEEVGVFFMFSSNGTISVEIGFDFL